jgi:hypothetical protein
LPPTKTASRLQAGPSNLEGESAVEYTIVNLGKDFPGKITDFAYARNYFLTKHDWVLFVDDDEEACDMLLNYLENLAPTFPYYWIRRFNLYNGRYRGLWNPDFAPRLVSNKVRFVGRVHERVVPKEPHGMIDFPIIHNHRGPVTYKNYWYQDNPLYRMWLGVKKALEVVRDR